MGLGCVRRRNKEVVINHLQVIAEQFSHDGQHRRLPEQLQQRVGILDRRLHLLQNRAPRCCPQWVRAPNRLGAVGGIPHSGEFRSGEGLWKNKVAVCFVEKALRLSQIIHRV